jgi:hypothetical protein
MIVYEGIYAIVNEGTNCIVNGRTKMYDNWMTILEKAAGANFGQAGEKFSRTNAGSSFVRTSTFQLDQLGHAWRIADQASNSP